LKWSCIVTVAGIAIAAPFLLHQYMVRDYIDVIHNIERFALEINLWVYAAAIPAIFIALKRRGKYLFILSLLLVSLVPVAFGYRYRYLSGQGSIALIVLSALSLDIVYDRCIDLVTSQCQQKKKRLCEFVVFLLFLITFLLVSPTIMFNKGAVTFHMLNSTYANFIPGLKPVQRPNEFSIYYHKYFNEIKEIIHQHSNPEDIIYCNKEYIAGLLGAVSHRATSTAMVHEVKPYKRTDPIASAKLIVWMKNPDRPVEKQVAAVAERYKLIKLAETDFAHIYENPNPQGKRKVVAPLVSQTTIGAIACLLIGVAVYDIFRRQSAL
ncbi:hypothetical protein ACFL38_05275, partial [Candidatus Omnitrophota bacterium]